MSLYSTHLNIFTFSLNPNRAYSVVLDEEEGVGNSSSLPLLRLVEGATPTYSSRDANLVQVDSFRTALI